jgi:hypothetical protein
MVRNGSEEGGYGNHVRWEMFSSECGKEKR